MALKPAAEIEEQDNVTVDNSSLNKVKVVGVRITFFHIYLWRTHSEFCLVRLSVRFLIPCLWNA